MYMQENNKLSYSCLIINLPFICKNLWFLHFYSLSPDFLFILLSRRHFSEQNLTSSQTFFQRLRQFISLLQNSQIFVGRFDLVYFLLIFFVITQF